ncbi:response regulator [Pseudomonas sp. SO81]|jgi:CheY-like chemotaxis protein|uniref:response regulator n=1 Tax=Pseudomonas sp. SO81 TaxID=2983246 RepID=UPI0025A4AF5B|nr:response regulator [Pseudomonas sp. SO81]WJN58852.1 Two-component transcriptional response regulator, LuxR family [Pseudomonas sp. SO81]
MKTKIANILIADDDQDDCLMTREAFRECRIANRLHFVHDGEALLDYLKRRPPYDDEQRFPMPGLILLDLNMPLKDGREALMEIKADAALRVIPVVILTTSSAEEDVLRSYDIGVNSFITKPVSYSGLLEVIRALGRYWLDIVELPLEGAGV